MTDIIYLLFIAFGIKHLWIDFLWQTPFEWQNKGTYGHFGGIQHSGKHAIVTFLMLAILSLLLNISMLLVLAVSMVEFVVHYHMDWDKVNINKKYGWEPTTHKEFWFMLGIDQFVHFLNYIWIVWIVIG